MAAPLYIIPLITCAVLYFGFHPQIGLLAYACILLGGCALIGLMHWLMALSRRSCNEFLGTFVTQISYEDPWTERVERTETKTDSNGKTYTVKKVEYVHHSESISFYTQLGSIHFCYSGFFASVRDFWGAPRHNDVWHGSNIVGGARYGHHYVFHEACCGYGGLRSKCVPVTEEHSYENRIRNSNSIFRFEKVTKQEAEQEGLYEYPEMDDDYDVPAVLSAAFPVSYETDMEYRLFNALDAPERQMRLFVLIYDETTDVSTAERQRAYWKGGNKNELVVCIGVRKDRTVKWAHAFSWADEQTLEVKAAQYLLRQPTLDLNDFLEWFKSEYQVWVRKEFKDFKYVSVPLTSGQLIAILITSLIENGLVLAFVR